MIQTVCPAGDLGKSADQYSRLEDGSQRTGLSKSSAELPRFSDLHRRPFQFVPGWFTTGDARCGFLRGSVTIDRSTGDADAAPTASGVAIAHRPSPTADAND